MSSSAIAKPPLENLALQRAVRILTAILLLLILAFFFLASSICITLVLSSFLAILADPAVNALIASPRAPIPRRRHGCSMWSGPGRRVSLLLLSAAQRSLG